MTADIQEQIASAYRRMAADAGYRPMAPGDGWGNIVFPEAELDIDAECADYIARWWPQEEEQSFSIGCPDYPDRPALIFAIEAARAICSVQPVLAKRLLHLAADALPDESPTNDL